MFVPQPSDLLRSLPQVEELLRLPEVCSLEAQLPRPQIANYVREVIDSIRQSVLQGASSIPSNDELAQAVCARVRALMQPSLRPVINATGVVVHTNLGRSPLAPAAIQAVEAVTRGYSTLEYDTTTRQRGSRHTPIEQLLCTLTGAEAAMAVNNNAAAVVMVLHEFARGREVVVSRGELVEIGGSFRIPDIMELSQAHMVEVGTTNKTHVSDYEKALGANTALLLKVHPSNYRVVGFTESVSTTTLHELANQENNQRSQQDMPDSEKVLVYEDQGSGAFTALDTPITPESTIAQALQAGCDLVSFSGDKLLGGPQAGIIVGTRSLIARLKKNPYARAMRLDKMTLAALEATLRLYLNPEQACQSIPTLRMLTEPAESVRLRAEHLAQIIASQASPTSLQVAVVPETSRAGGGALPLCEIDSYAVRLSFPDGDAQSCETFLVSSRTLPIVGRISKNTLLLDARTLTESELPEIGEALRAYLAQGTRAIEDE